ncbi:MAG TPA: hypothetical protein VGQ83_18960 [Polyangia bacterium]|jgi:hypothetical protein
MARLNLTLDDDTFAALERDARGRNQRLATYARALLQEGLARRQRAQQARRWAEAYRADRPDARQLLRDLEPGELELLGDEDA